MIEAAQHVRDGCVEFLTRCSDAAPRRCQGAREGRSDALAGARMARGRWLLPAGLALTESWEADSSVAPWSEEVAESATDGAERPGRARLVLGGAC